MLRLPLNCTPVKVRKANSSDYLAALLRKSFHNEKRKLNKDELKQCAFLSVKALSIYEDKEDMSLRFQLSERIIDLLSLLTPDDFIEVFPVKKQYDDHKCGIKDYFYVLKHVATLKSGVPIGNEIHYLLRNYLNDNICGFYSKYLLLFQKNYQNIV